MLFLSINLCQFLPSIIIAIILWHFMCIFLFSSVSSGEQSAASVRLAEATFLELLSCTLAHGPPRPVILSLVQCQILLLIGKHWGRMLSLAVRNVETIKGHVESAEADKPFTLCAELLTRARGAWGQVGELATQCVRACWHSQESVNDLQAAKLQWCSA